MNREIVAKCGHVTRRLMAGEPLKGKTLEFALTVIDSSKEGFSSEQFLVDMRNKLIAETELSDYEKHIMGDVLMLNYRFDHGED